MAKRVDSPKKTKTKGADEGAEDLAILHPEQTLTLAGRQVTVREYGFVEGLKLRPLYQPLVEGLYELATNDQVPELDALQGLLAEHYETTLRLIATAADVKPEWIGTLSASEGERLMDVWWQVNGPFFLRKLSQRLLADRELLKLAAGQTSTKHSSKPGTTPSGSGTTPNGKSFFTTAPPPAPKTGKEAPA